MDPAFTCACLPTSTRALPVLVRSMMARPPPAADTVRLLTCASKSWSRVALKVSCLTEIDVLSPIRAFASPMIASLDDTPRPARMPPLPA